MVLCHSLLQPLNYCAAKSLYQLKDVLVDLHNSLHHEQTRSFTVHLDLAMFWFEAALRWPRISVPYSHPLALMLPASHLAPSFTAIRTRQSTLLKAEACADCISHMHCCSILTSAQHLRGRHALQICNSPIFTASPDYMQSSHEQS